MSVEEVDGSEPRDVALRNDTVQFTFDPGTPRELYVEAFAFDADATFSVHWCACDTAWQAVWASLRR